MQRKLLDILACPMDKHYPLDLYDLRSDEERILEGVLFCSNCGRYYPIMDEIPIMLPDELRNREESIGFLRKWGSSLPDRIVYEGKPFALSKSS